MIEQPVPADTGGPKRRTSVRRRVRLAAFYIAVAAAASGITLALTTNDALRSGLYTC
jgi:hypothetical protein